MAGIDDTVGRDLGIESTLDRDMTSISPFEILDARGIASNKSPKAFGLSPELMSYKTVRADVDEILKMPQENADTYAMRMYQTHDLRFPSLKSLIDDRALKDAGVYEREVSRIPEHVQRNLATSAIIGQSQFQRGPQSTFMHRSLSLQYMATGELKRIGKTLGDIGRLLEDKLEAIKLNTAAPDGRKSSFMGKIRSAFRGRLIDTIVDKTNDARNALIYGLTGKESGEAAGHLFRGAANFLGFQGVPSGAPSEVLNTIRTNAGSALWTAGTRLARHAQEVEGDTPGLLGRIAQHMTTAGDVTARTPVPDMVTRGLDTFFDRVREYRTRDRTGDVTDLDDREDYRPSSVRRHAFESTISEGVERLNRAVSEDARGHSSTLYGVVSRWYEDSKKSTAVTEKLLQSIADCSCRHGGRERTVGRRTPGSRPEVQSRRASSTATTEPEARSAVSDAIARAAEAAGTVAPGYTTIQNTVANAVRGTPSLSEVLDSTVGATVRRAAQHTAQIGAAATPVVDEAVAGHTSGLRHRLSSLIHRGRVSAAGTASTLRGMIRPQTADDASGHADAVTHEVRDGVSWNEQAHLRNPLNNPQVDPGTSYAGAAGAASGTGGLGVPIPKSWLGRLLGGAEEVGETGLSLGVDAAEIGAGALLARRLGGVGRLGAVLNGVRGVTGLAEGASRSAALGRGLAAARRIPVVGESLTAMGDIVSPFVKGVTGAASKSTLLGKAWSIGRGAAGSYAQAMNPLHMTRIARGAVRGAWGLGQGAAEAVGIADRANRTTGVLRNALRLSRGTAGMTARAARAGIGLTKAVVPEFASNMMRGHGSMMSALETGAKLVTPTIDRIAPGVTSAIGRGLSTKTGMTALKLARGASLMGDFNLLGLAGTAGGLATDILFKDPHSTANITGHVLSGAAEGAGWGAMLGSIVPGLGTAVGAAGGALVGATLQAAMRINSVGHVLGNLTKDAAKGAAIGGTLGWFIPGIGPIIGAAAGGIAGGLTGLATGVNDVAKSFGGWTHVGHALTASIVGEGATFNRDGSIKSLGEGGAINGMRDWIFGADAKTDPKTGMVTPPKHSFTDRLTMGLQTLFGAQHYGGQAANKDMPVYGSGSSDVDPNDPHLNDSLAKMKLGASGWVNSASLASRPKGLWDKDNRKLADQPEYKEVVAKLPGDVQKYIGASNALQELAWSTAIQSGPEEAVRVLKDAYAPGVAPVDYMKRVYQQRQQLLLQSVDAAQTAKATQQLGNEMRMNIKDQQSIEKGGSGSSFSDQERMSGAQFQTVGNDYATQSGYGVAGDSRFSLNGNISGYKGEAVKISNGETKRRIPIAMRFFVKQGWTQAQAAGIVGNLIKESQLNERAVGDSGSAIGIAQWHPDRQRKIASAMRQMPQDMSFEQQLAAVDWELKNSEKGAGNALKQAKTGEEAGAIVSKLYERPAARDKEAADRGATAMSLLSDKSLMGIVGGNQTLGQVLGTSGGGTDASSAGGTTGASGGSVTQASTATSAGGSTSPQSQSAVAPAVNPAALPGDTPTGTPAATKAASVAATADAGQQKVTAAATAAVADQSAAEAKAAQTQADLKNIYNTSKDPEVADVAAIAAGMRDYVDQAKIAADKQTKLLQGIHDATKANKSGTTVVAPSTQNVNIHAPATSISLSKTRGS